MCWALLLTLAACNNKEANQEAESYIGGYRNFVDSLQRTDQEYTHEEYHQIQEEYSLHRAAAENKTPEMTEAQQQELEEITTEYETFRDEYRNRLPDRATQSPQELISKRWQEAGIASDASEIAPANVLDAYQVFIQVVKAYKEVWTPDEWQSVEKLWDRLNERKQNLEDELGKEVLLAISKLKVTYGTLKTMNNDSL